MKKTYRNILLKLSFIIVFAFGELSIAYSQFNTWICPELVGSFGDATNWSLGTVPTTLNRAVFNDGRQITVKDVPTGSTFSGIEVNFGTHVTFEFDNASTYFTLDTLIVEEGSTLYSEAALDIYVNNYTNLNQAEIIIESSNLNFDINCQTYFAFNVVINAQYVYNSGIIHLLNAYLSLNAFLDNNNGDFNFDEGTLDVNKGILFNGSYFGSPNCTLRIASSAVDANISPLYPGLQLGTLVNEAGFNLNMEGDLVIQELLNLISGNISIGNNRLTLRGDTKYESGAIVGGDASNIEIQDDTFSPDTMLLKLDPSSNTLNSFMLSRPGKVVKLLSDMEVVQGLDLTGGKVLLENHVLTLGYLTTLYYDVNSYIITRNNGYVKTMNQPLIPIGTDNYYAGLEITQGASVDFEVRVFDGVYSEGTGGYPLDPSELVNVSWVINPSVDGTTVTYDTKFEWDVAAEGSSFVLTDAKIMFFNGIEWTYISTLSDPGTGIAGTNSHSFLATTNSGGVYAIASQSNQAPVVYNQEFTIPEHSPAGTVVDTIVFSDPDVEQRVYLEPHDHPYLSAFTADTAGVVYVVRPEMLEYSETPTLTFTIDACDNGLPVMCSTFDVIINLEEVELYVTNYISPNGDNKNDAWYIEGIENIKHEIFIFNSSGNIVYRTEDYHNDWKGTSRGVRLPPGVYFYLIKTPYGNQKGTITLVR